MYSFLMNDEKCIHCGVNLVGEGTVTVEGDLQSVNEALRIVENMSDGSDLEDTDVILDLRCPEITCAEASLAWPTCVKRAAGSRWISHPALATRCCHSGRPSM